MKEHPDRREKPLRIVTWMEAGFSPSPPAEGGEGRERRAFTTCLILLLLEQNVIAAGCARNIAARKSILACLLSPALPNNRTGRSR